MIVDLSDKVAIVTGAGQGIGEGIARVFAKAGAKIVIATRSRANGQSVADSIVKSGGVAWLNQTDVGRHAEVKRVVAETVERFGRLDIVVHNAGVYPVLPIEQLSDADLDLTLSVNLKAGFWLIQESLPHLRKRGGGRFLFTSSVTGPNVAMPGTAHYAASKCGINGLIRTAALEYARQNITVNGVEPGYILTPDGRTGWAGGACTDGDPDSARQVGASHRHREHDVVSCLGRRGLHHGTDHRR